MKPVLFHLPFVGWGVKGYGLMLMIGFLLAVWVATRRAAKVRANPDIVLNVGFVALICGVIGARLFYYIHYFPSYYAHQPHPFLAILNVTRGGLTFYGGFIGGLLGILLYLLKKRVSLRLYLDILAPSLVLGLAFGRVGCFLNGCCFGDVCADQADRARLPWAITFPYASPAHSLHWQHLQTTVPKELVVVHDVGLASLIRRENIYFPPTPKQLSNPKDKAKYADLIHQANIYGKTTDQIAQLARQYRSLPVQPTQIYSSINAFMIAGVLSLIFAYRRRHGVVVCWTFILYGISRILLEAIRTNPHDVFGLTISQAVSVVMIGIGLLLLAIFRTLPLASKRAVPFIPPQEPPKK